MGGMGGMRGRGRDGEGMGRGHQQRDSDEVSEGIEFEVG